MFVYLPYNGYYYIDVALPTSNYSSATLKIEKLETNSIGIVRYVSNFSNEIFSVGIKINFS